MSSLISRIFACNASSNCLGVISSTPAVEFFTRCQLTFQVSCSFRAVINRLQAVAAISSFYFQLPAPRHSAPGCAASRWFRRCAVASCECHLTWAGRPRLPVLSNAITDARIIQTAASLYRLAFPPKIQLNLSVKSYRKTPVLHSSTPAHYTPKAPKVQPPPGRAEPALFELAPPLSPHPACVT